MRPSVPGLRRPSVRWGVTLAVAAVLGAATELLAKRPPDLLQLRVRRGDAPARPLGDVLEKAPAIVAFWATYCPPCRAEVPILQRAARRWRSRGVRVLGVALDVGDPARAARAAAEWGIDYESYWTPADQLDAAERLLPNGLPVTFFVGPAGVTRHDRFLSDKELEPLIPKHLGVTPPPEKGGD